MDYDWADLAFGSKKPLRELRATFIAAPRDISAARMTELIKAYLPVGNIVLGLAKEDYVLGFEDQPQFRMLTQKSVQKIIQKVRASRSKFSIYTLRYHQRETKFIIEKVHFKKAVFVNGSWKYTFHNTEIFGELLKSQIPYELVAAFCDEKEARAYEARVMPLMAKRLRFAIGPYSDEQMMEIAALAATLSFDTSYQTGVAIGKKHGKNYDLVTYAYNKVVPFQTYALLHGSTRETHFSPPHDQNHYDTVHAETEAILRAAADAKSLKGTTLFTNLLPCPSCSRMLADSQVHEIVYSADHSEGYAVHLLEAAGKKVRRFLV